MPSKAGFPSMAPLGGHQWSQSHSNLVRRQRQVRPAVASKPDRTDILLTLGLVAITVGLIALRAAIWLPPLAI
jgi:hypothetical protein